ncbi:MAG: DUF378 domain-containing protein [Myxococcota bacterium]|nr:DUF378 domain-containing protein [Myxococcota bacterium]
MDASKAKTTSTITKILILVAIIGAVNWGLIGLFNFNLVDAIFGGGSAEETSSASRVVYALVGISGLAAALLLPRLRDRELVNEPQYAGRAT